MKNCPKCGRVVDDEMVICPFCAELLYDPKTQNKTEFVNIHLVRWLLLLSLVIPLLGFIMAVSLKKKYPLISKIIVKFATFGIAILGMLFILGIICYIALTQSGVTFL